MKNYYKIIGIIFLNIILFSNNAPALISLFPMDNYSQDLNKWFPEDAEDYNTPLLSKDEQDKYFQELKQNYFGTDENSNSPWSQSYIEFLLKPEAETNKTIHIEENHVINNIKMSLDESRGWARLHGANFRAHDEKWINTIADNINLDSLKDLSYDPNNRAITTDNTSLLGLPTIDPAFRSHQAAGEGYPFDYNRMSGLTAGSPVYILSATTNQAWYLVVSPVGIGWVQAQKVAKTDSNFIKTWQKAIEKRLGGIIKFHTEVIDTDNTFHFLASVGTLLPIVSDNDNSVEVMIPVKSSDGTATIKNSTLNAADVAIIPLALTKANFRRIIANTLGTTYGWGDLNEYRDCSSDIRGIYMNFGIYMPRNSWGQANHLGTPLDYSKSSMKVRADKLKEFGKPLLSLIYINGHVMLYLGEYKDGKTTKLMTYQNIWGLKPKSDSRRAVIGRSVIFPLMFKYKEDPELASLLDKKFFKIIQFDTFNGGNTKLGLSNLMN